MFMLINNKQRIDGHANETLTSDRKVVTLLYRHKPYEPILIIHILNNNCNLYEKHDGKCPENADITSVIHKLKTKTRECLL